MHGSVLVPLQRRSSRFCCQTEMMTIGSRCSLSDTRRVPAGEALIRGGEPGRTLYFVLRGPLEVIAHSGDGLSLGRMAVVPRDRSWESNDS